MHSSVSKDSILPRLIRLKDAPAYLGVNINFFNQKVRPYVTEVRLGKQMVAFDRVDLDAWAEHHKCRNGRPAAKEAVWDANQRNDDIHAEELIGATAGNAGSSTRSGRNAGFTASLTRITRMKRTAS